MAPRSPVLPFSPSFLPLTRPFPIPIQPYIYVNLIIIATLPSPAVPPGVGEGMGGDGAVGVSVGEQLGDLGTHVSLDHEPFDSNHGYDMGKTIF